MQTVGHNLATEQQQINNLACEKKRKRWMLKGNGQV